MACRKPARCAGAGVPPTTAEVFTALPVVLVLRLGVAVEFTLLEGAEVVDEAGAESLGEQVVARVDHGDPGWQSGPGRQFGVQWRADPFTLRRCYAVAVELDFQPAAHCMTRIAEPGPGLLQNPPGIEVYRSAILEPWLAQHPAGMGGPRQLAVGLRIGQQHQVGSACESGRGSLVVRLEDLVRRAIGCVLEQQAADHADAFCHGPCGGAGHQGLAAQHTVLVAPGEAHQFHATGCNRLRQLLDARLTGPVLDAATPSRGRAQGRIRRVVRPVANIGAASCHMAYPGRYV